MVTIDFKNGRCREKHCYPCFNKARCRSFLSPGLSPGLIQVAADRVTDGLQRNAQIIKTHRAECQAYAVGDDA